MTPDPAGNAVADPSNPQSWNLYAYVLNNPLSNIDPLGLDCVYLNDAGNGVESIDHDSNPDECSGNNNGGYWIPGTVADSSWVTDIDQNNDQIGAYSRFDNGTLGWTGSTNQLGGGWGTVGIDIATTSVGGNVYTSADDMSPSAQRAIIAIAKAAPTVCGGGVYYYAGREVSGFGAHGFGGAINEYDSVGGKSSGALVEGGVGEGVMAGGGVIATPNGNGSLEGEGLLFGGAGVDTPVASASAGIVGFQSGIGLYAEGFFFGKGGGGGAYLNLSTNAGCPKHK